MRTGFLHGEWKRHPNNPVRDDGTVFVYCPPEQVPGQMEDLIRFHQAHTQAPPEVSAAWLHHRFTQIHPFQDGNGRVARALATIEFLRGGLFPLVIDRDQRAAYIKDLESADQGDLRPLIDLFAENERRALLRALGFAEETLAEAANLRMAAQALAHRLQQSYREPLAAVEQAAATAQLLADRVAERFALVRSVLQEERSAVDVGVQVAIDRSTEHNSHFFHAQVMEVANKHFDYFVNFRAPKNWVRLHFRNGLRADLIFSFHSVGYQPRGGMACVAFTNVRYERGPNAAPEWSVEPACDKPFTFSHAVPVEALQGPFLAWVDEAIHLGLDAIRNLF